MRYDRVKMKSEPNNYKNSIKAIIWGLLGGALVCMAFLFIVSFAFLKMKSVPFPMINAIALVCASFGAFAAGYITVRIHKKNGMAYGAVSGMMLFLIFTVVGFVVSRDKFTYLTMVKFPALTLAGAIGGILAVNKRVR